MKQLPVKLKLIILNCVFVYMFVFALACCDYLLSKSFKNVLVE